MASGSSLPQSKTKSIRVMVVAHSLRGRGTERTVIRLLNAWDRTTIQPLLILFEAKGEFLGKVPEEVEVRFLFKGDESYSARRFFQAVRRLLKIYDDLNPDIVLAVHTTPGRISAAGKFLRREMRLVVYETDPFSRVERIKGGLITRVALTRILYRKPNAFIAASNVVARDLNRVVKIPHEKIHIVPNPCIDNEVFEMAKETVSDWPFSERPRQKIILNVGNLYAHKSQDTLIEAFRLVLESGFDCHLVIIGEGPERKKLENLVQELGLEGRVHLLGFVENPFKYMANADVYVSSSSSEGFDISQVEAMALGLPVIVTSGERYMIVKDGESGLVVSVGDVNQLASAITRVLNNPRLARSFSERAIKQALELSSKNIARQYVKIFEKVLK